MSVSAVSTSQTAQESWNCHIGETLITGVEIAQKLEELADKIAAKHRCDLRPLVLIPILKGGASIGMELVKLLGTRGTAVRIDFLWYQSYAGTESTGTVQQLADLQSDIKDESVMLVDDLIDTGLTLATAHANLLSKKPATLEICVLLEKLEVKRHQLAIDLVPDYIGFQIPPQFIIGACMDYKEHFRSLNDIVLYKKGPKTHLCDIDLAQTHEKEPNKIANCN